MSNITFADIINERLRDLGWRKNDLARRLNVSPSRINNLLKQSAMTETVFQKCLYVLGLAMEIQEVSRPAPPYELRPAKKANSRMSVEVSS